MDYGIDRAQALDLVRQQLSNPNLIKHCLATEAVMRALAKKLGADPEQWGLAGLLHDLDAEQTEGDLAAHTHETVRVLRQQGVDPEIVEAIRLHNEAAHPDRRANLFQHALAAGETITGLITATALVYPDKKLASVKPKSVTKRFKERAFAAGADREIISECGKLGMELDEFAALCLGAMQGIAGELGL
ncbi:MAG: HDIG domain-containing protein [Deltaproteobacteria bacterium]|nr:HDIG domain-containing protein [Deltaproteobacteria bacterium]